MQSLNPHIIIRIITKSVHKPFVIEKLLRAREDILQYIPPLADYQELVKSNLCGLIYPKIKLENSFPCLSLLVTATLMNYHEMVRTIIRNLSCKKTLNYFYIIKATRLAISFDYIDVLKAIYMNDNNKIHFSSQLIYDAYVEGSQEVVSFVHDVLHIKPTVGIFCHMLYTNKHINFIPFIPESIPLEIVKLSYLFQPREPLLLQTLTDAIDEKNRTCDDSNEFMYSDIEFQLYTIYENYTPYPTWRVFQFLWEYYQTYPKCFCITSCFEETVKDNDLEGVTFIINTMGWKPKHIDMHYDIIFLHEDIARYLITELNITDWEHIFEKVFRSRL